MNIIPDIIIPPRKKPTSENEYFEVLSKAVFQAGFSWKVVEKRWFFIKEAFVDFDVHKIKNYGGDEVGILLENPNIIRNRKKIEAIIENAKTFVEIQNEYGTFAKYIESIRDDGYKFRVKDISTRFRWLGRTGAFFFFYCINEETPEWKDR